MFAISSNSIGADSLGLSTIKLEDMDMYTSYIKGCQYPANLWSSNFPFLWCAGQSKLRNIAWKVVNGMLVTFGHSNKDTLYLYCLPFGRGSAEKLVETLYISMKYCYKWNNKNKDKDRTKVRMINEAQLEFLRSCPRFDKLFRLVTLKGIERHYGVENLVNLQGKDFATIRNKVNKFYRENSEARIRKYTHKDYERLIELGKEWGNTFGKKYDNIFDNIYYKEILKHNEDFKQTCLVMEKGEKIVGMVSGGELPTGQSWGSVIKFQEGIQGLSETLAVEFAREINRLNPDIEFLNVGSDLGAGGLRDYKLKFRPVLNFKRYQVFLK